MENQVRCSQCNNPIDGVVAAYSLKKFGNLLCRDDQKKQPGVYNTTPYAKKEWTPKPSFEANQKERQQGIEETARLRRELDWQIACMEIAKDLVIAKVIPANEMVGAAINLGNLEEFLKKEIKPDKVIKETIVKLN